MVFVTFSDYVFNMDKKKRGFEVAFAFTPFDDDEELLFEPDYGEVKVFLKHWDVDGSTQFDEAVLRTCSEEELGVGPLGFEDPQAKF